MHTVYTGEPLARGRPVTSVAGRLLCGTVWAARLGNPPPPPGDHMLAGVPGWHAHPRNCRVDAAAFAPNGTEPAVAVDHRKPLTLLIELNAAMEISGFETGGAVPRG